MVSEDIMTYLASQAIGVPNTDLFIRQMPDEPDNCITIYDEAGSVVTEAQNYDVDVLGSQIMVRGSYAYASDKILEIHRHLSGWSFSGNIEILSTHIQTEPAFLENDDKGRAKFTAHYEHYSKIGNNINRTSK